MAWKDIGHFMFPLSKQSNVKARTGLVLMPIHKIHVFVINVGSCSQNGLRWWLLTSQSANVVDAGQVEFYNSKLCCMKSVKPSYKALFLCRSEAR